MGVLESGSTMEAAMQRDRAVSGRLGFVGLGATLIFFSLGQVGLLPLDNGDLASGLFYGGLAQLLTGLLEWRRGCSFAAVTFIALGFFWLSLIALFISPMVGWSGRPQDVALSSYLVMWALYAGLLFTAALRFGRLLCLLFAMLSLFLLALAAGTMTGLPGLLLASHLAGCGCGVGFLLAGIVRGRRQAVILRSFLGGKKA